MYSFCEFILFKLDILNSHIYDSSMTQVTRRRGMIRRDRTSNQALLFLQGPRVSVVQCGGALGYSGVVQCGGGALGYSGKASVVHCTGV